MKPTSEPKEPREPFLRIRPAVAILLILLGMVGAELIEDAFTVARNYSWSPAALIPLVQIVALNAALVGSAALVGWLVQLGHRKRWHAAVELSVLYAFAVAGWLLAERVLSLFVIL